MVLLAAVPAYPPQLLQQLKSHQQTSGGYCSWPRNSLAQNEKVLLFAEFYMDKHNFVRAMQVTPHFLPDSNLCAKLTSGCLKHWLFDSQKV